MTPHQQPRPVAAIDRERLEALLLEFDQGWSPDSLGMFSRRLKRHAPEFRQAALIELVKIDLERSWACGMQQLVEDYLRQHPELGTADSVSAEIIHSECEARRQAGQELDGKQLRSRFPNQFDELKKLLARPRVSRAAASIDTSRPGHRDTTADAACGVASLPEMFGRYRILQALGKGAMGAVYLAHDTKLDRRIALKTPAFQHDQSPELLERFYREAKAVAALHHANICPVFDVGEINGIHFIAMTFIEGRTLADYIRADGVPERSAAMLVRKLALALEHAHQKGIVHRDLKPANIMLDSATREPIVMDFGLARRDTTPNEARMTRNGVIMGTPAYMPPEQVEGDQSRIGPASDIYSLGVILYELLTGRLPFEGSLAMILAQIATQEPRKPSELRSDIDPALEAICLRMIAKRIGDRYRSMQEVADALTDWLKGRTASKTSRVARAGASIAGETGPARSEDNALTALFAAAAKEKSAGVSTREAKTHATMTAREGQSSDGNRRRVTRWLLGAGAAAFVAMLSIVILIYTQDGTVRVETDGRRTSIAVREAGTGVDSPAKAPSTNPEAAPNEAVPPAGNAPPPNTDRPGSIPAETPERAPASEEPKQELDLQGGPKSNPPQTDPMPAEATSTGEEQAQPPQPQPPLNASPIKLEHGNHVFAVAFSPNGRWLASGGLDGLVKLWSVEPGAVAQQQNRINNRKKPAKAQAGVVGRLVRTITFGTGVYQIVFSSDSAIVGICGGPSTLDRHKRVRFWSVDRDELEQVLQGRELLGPIAFHPQRRTTFVATNSRNEIALLDIDPDKKPVLIGNSPQPIVSMAISDDGLACATGHQNMLGRLWNLGEQAGPTRLVKEWQFPFEHAASKGMNTVAFDPVHHGLILDNAAHPTYLDLKTFNTRWEYRAHTWGMFDMEVSRDGAWLASCGEQNDPNHVVITDIAAGAKKIALGLTLEKEGANAVAFHPNYQLLASGGPDNQVRLWAAGSWTEHKPEAAPPPSWKRN